MNHNGQRRPEQIEADIERTRGDLNATLSAIERRLSPGELVDHGLDYLRHSGARQYAGSLAHAAKRDPIPLALVGVGLAWLMASSRRSDASFAPAGDTAGIGQKLSQTGQRLADTAHAAGERASRGAERVRDGAQRIRGSYEHMLHEHPLAFGAIGLAVGAVLAAAPRDLRSAGPSHDERAPRGEAGPRALRETAHERDDPPAVPATPAASNEPNDQPWPGTR